LLDIDPWPADVAEASRQIGNARRKSGELSAARHPRERLGVDENSAIIIERAFGVVSITRNLLNQFAIRLENSRICTPGVVR
jgi:hypothetical protein